MKNPGNALDLLTAQHEEVDELLEAIEATDDAAEKEEIFGELADKLAAHAAMEEEIFYPWVNTKKTEDELLEATEEHLAIKRVLADLIELDADDPRFAAKLNVMKEELTHHAHEEEEDKLFPQVRKMATAAELEALGAEMLARFEELLADDPSAKVKDETDRAAPL